jgi:DNA-binding NarL/FixJ family response regulator
LVLLGMTNKQIAQDLRIAEDTVKKHLQHIYKKVGVHRRALLMVENRQDSLPRQA